MTSYSRISTGIRWIRLARRCQCCAIGVLQRRCCRARHGRLISLSLHSPETTDRAADGCRFRRFRARFRPEQHSFARFRPNGQPNRENSRAKIITASVFSTNADDITLRTTSPRPLSSHATHVQQYAHHPSHISHQTCVSSLACAPPPHTRMAHA